MNFDAYDLDAAFHDEMFLPDGTPREHCRALYDALRQLSVDDLASMQERVTRSFSNEGITFTVYGDDEADERIIPVDCVPRIVSGADWTLLESGLSQRIGALNRFLEDVYDKAHIVLLTPGVYNSAFYEHMFLAHEIGTDNGAAEA